MGEVPIATSRDMRFLHDVAHPHFSSAVADHFISTFQNQMVCHTDPVQWPPCSLDLDPLNSYLQGTLEARMHCAKMNTWKEPWDHVQCAATEMRTMPEVLQSVQWS
jgi:hypothetical protein